MSRVEGGRSIRRAVARARISRADLGGAAGNFGAGRKVERVQPLVVITLAVFAHANGEERAVRALVAVDHRSRGDANLRRDLAAVVVIAGRLAGAQNGGFPELGSVIGVERIHAVVLGGNVEHIALLASHRHVGHEKGLGVDFAIDCIEGDLPELCRVHIAQCQDGLLRIQAVARVVVVVRGHVRRACRRRG